VGYRFPLDSNREHPLRPVPSESQVTELQPRQLNDNAEGIEIILQFTTSGTIVYKYLRVHLDSRLRLATTRVGTLLGFVSSRNTATRCATGRLSDSPHASTNRHISPHYSDSPQHVSSQRTTAQHGPTLGFTSQQVVTQHAATVLDFTPPRSTPHHVASRLQSPPYGSRINESA